MGPQIRANFRRRDLLGVTQEPGTKVKSKLWEFERDRWPKGLRPREKIKLLRS